MMRLTDPQRALLDEGLAIVVRCEACDSEHFIGELPMPVDQMVRVTRRFKCPTDKSHKLLIGPLPDPVSSPSERGNG